MRAIPAITEAIPLEGRGPAAEKSSAGDPLVFDVILAGELEEASAESAASPREDELGEEPPPVQDGPPEEKEVSDDVPRPDQVVLVPVPIPRESLRIPLVEVPTTPVGEESEQGSTRVEPGSRQEQDPNEIAVDADVSFDPESPAPQQELDDRDPPTPSAAAAAATAEESPVPPLGAGQRAAPEDEGEPTTASKGDIPSVVSRLPIPEVPPDFEPVSPQDIDAEGPFALSRDDEVEPQTEPDLAPAAVPRESSEVEGTPAGIDADVETDGDADALIRSGSSGEPDGEPARDREEQPAFDRTHESDTSQEISFEGRMAESVPPAKPAPVPEAEGRQQNGLDLPPEPPSDDPVRSILFNFDGKTQEARIVLSPEELGEVEIHLEIRDDNLHAHVTAETRQALDLLESRIADLQTGLQSRGINLASLGLALGNHRKQPSGSRPPPGGSPARKELSQERSPFQGKASRSGIHLDLTI